MYICFHPEVRGWPLILGDDAEGPSTETNILAQELNKLHSSDQTTTTVQNSWYCTIIRRKPINNEHYSNIRSVDVNDTHMWVLEGVVWLRWAPQACVHPGSPPRGSPRSLPESLERSGLCTYSSSLGRQHHPHLGISLPKHTRSVPSFQIHYRYYLSPSRWCWCSHIGWQQHHKEPRNHQLHSRDIPLYFGIPFGYSHWLLTHSLSSLSTGGDCARQSEQWEELTQANREVRSGRRDDTDMAARRSQVFQLKCSLEQDGTCRYHLTDKQ